MLRGCIASAGVASHLYAEGVGLLPRDYYVTVRLDNACIANAHHCGPFQLVSTLHVGQGKLYLSPLTELQPAATQHHQTWKYKSFKHYKTANISGKIVVICVSAQ